MKFVVEILINNEISVIYAEKEKIVNGLKVFFTEHNDHIELDIGENHYSLRKDEGFELLNMKVEVRDYKELLQELNEYMAGVEVKDPLDKIYEFDALKKIKK